METFEKFCVSQNLPLILALVVWRVDALVARLFAVLAWLLLIAPNLAAATCCADSLGHLGLCLFGCKLLAVVLLLRQLLLLVVVLRG